MKNIYRFLIEKYEKIPGLALATIISSSGSAPQKEGASALLSSNGLEAGTVGGGALEETVKYAAIKSITEKRPVIISVNLENSTEDYESAICGGTVRVLIDPTILEKPDFITNLKEIIKRNVPFSVATLIYTAKGEQVRTEKYILAKDFSCENIPQKYRDLLAAESEKLLINKDAGSLVLIDSGNFTEEEKVFAVIEPIFPTPSLIIAGAGHIGKALSHLGRFLGFEVTVIDDRPEFANPANLPDADKIITDEIGPALGKIKKDSNTYIVIVTRGHARDAEALRECIGSNAAYIGMIGSRTKVEKMHQDFISKGWATEQQWARIHAPIGVKINSRSVEEIAVSIAAELIMIKNNNNTQGKI